MLLKYTPYWWDAAPLRAATNEPLSTSVDVAIVGSGYTGLTAALVLARAGVSVAVLEAGQIGEGASSRNGGMVGPSFHKLGVKGLTAKYGQTRANDILKESVGFVDFLANFLKTEGIDADFKQVGRFRGALNSTDYDGMARDLENLQTACGVSGHMVTAADQHLETGSARFCGGMVYDKDGGLHPGKYHAGLREKVLAAGVQLYSGAAVLDIDRTAGSYTLKTARGSMTAQKVAICTNGYTGKQFGQFHKKILPLRSALIATSELPAEVMDRLMPSKRMYVDSRRIIAYYRPSPDGKRILFGGRASGYVEQPDKNVKILRASMAEIFPELKSAELSHAWSGLVAYAFDHTPHLGQLDGLHFAMGYCGSGVARASYFGTKLGYKILGDTEAGRTSFDDIPLPDQIFYSGNPWFMPAILTWHRLADKLGF